MFTFSGAKHGQYKALADRDLEAEQEQDSARQAVTLQPPKRHNVISVKIWLLLSVKILIFAAAVITLVVYLSYSRDGSASASAFSGRCENPSVRREWRDLSDAEKMQYIGAVSCLHETPSRLDPDAKFSDDFAWLHFHVGSPSESLSSC